MQKLPLNAYKGARDFYPEDKQRQDYLFNTIRKVVQSFGYEEYDAPILEPIELYLAKSGQEIVNEQTYSFVDRGGRKVAIRPEMTPTVSRMVAARRQQLAYPVRWFSIPNLWRYERPQRGRLREHWQLNVDLFGVESQTAELEMLQLIDAIYKGFNADPSMYRFKLNHRQLMDYFFKELLKLDQDQSYKMAKLIDRKAKMSVDNFIDQADAIFTARQKQDHATEILMTVLDSQEINKLPEKLRLHQSCQELSKLVINLKKHGINNVDIDLTLMRGFDYYNGIVFEAFDTDAENNRSMLGGGRYDGLVGLFGVDPVPTVGFGLGDTVLANFLVTHHLMPDFQSSTDIYVVVAGDELEGALKVAHELRMAELNVATDITGRKLGDQLKTAVKKGIRFALIIGSQEVVKQLYTLRNLQTRQEQQLPIDKIIKIVTKNKSSMS